jgi:hypothetical protein
MDFDVNSFVIGAIAILILSATGCADGNSRPVAPEAIRDFHIKQ